MQFYKQHLEFLGFSIFRKGISPIPAKVEAIEKIKTPESLRDIQCFLGMIGYYQRFVPHFAGIATPLTHLLSKNVPFVWGREQQIAFDTLRKFLTTSPVLAYPDFEKEFIIHKDASLNAIGAVLSQL